MTQKRPLLWVSIVSTRRPRKDKGLGKWIWVPPPPASARLPKYFCVGYSCKLWPWSNAWHSWHGMEVAIIVMIIINTSSLLLCAVPTWHYRQTDPLINILPQLRTFYFKDSSHRHTAAPSVLKKKNERVPWATLWELDFPHYRGTVTLLWLHTPSAAEL